jgi:hypothetical protein
LSGQHFSANKNIHKTSHNWLPKEESKVTCCWQTCAFVIYLTFSLYMSSMLINVTAHYHLMHYIFKTTFEVQSFLQHFCHMLQLVKLAKKKWKQSSGCIPAMHWFANDWLWCSSITKKWIMVIEHFESINKKILHSNPMNTNFWNRKLFIQELYMQENLSLFLYEFWQEFKNLTCYTAKLCNWELPICDTQYINIQGQL